MSNLPELWEQYAKATKAVDAAIAVRDALLQKIRNVTTRQPSSRDVKICMASAQGETISSIAASHSISRTRAAQIIAANGDIVSGALQMLGSYAVREGYHGANGSVDAIVDTDWDEIDRNLDD